jgi:carbonic anhydrase/acetyltransferase-like protein (isoleucine patch superfamily)
MPLYEHKGDRPRLGRGVFIAPGATVIGDVVLGDESSVWFGAVIRGDVMPIRFGDRTNVQDGSIVHVTRGKAMTTVGSDVTIGHMALLHGCTVGDGVLIGMGSLLLDGAIVEDEAIVAAGALVSPGTRIPRRSLAVGRPARVVRALTDSDLAWIRESARAYVEYSRTFLSDAVRRIDDADDPALRGPVHDA